MELNDLRYLVASANTGNFTRVAKHFGINTSTISRRISLLEDELGLTLFERGPAGVRPTAGGLVVVEHARRALAEISAAVHAGMANGLGSEGIVRLGIGMTMIGSPVLELLTAWRARQPQVTLLVTELSDKDIMIALDERRLDAALVMRYVPQPYGNAIPLYRERLVVAFPARHQLAGLERIRWASFSGESLLVQEWEVSELRQLFLAECGDGIHFRAHLASRASIFGLVSAGFGVTLALESQAQTNASVVSVRAIDEPDAWAYIDLIWPQKLEDATVGRFVSFMRDEAQSRGLF